MNTLFDGPLATPPTPFTPSEDVAPEFIPDYVRWAVSQGVKGFFVLGTWGGASLLTFPERKETATAFIEASQAHGVPCIVNVGCPCIHEAELLAKHASQVGATAVAATVPYYHSGAGYYSIDHYREYFSRICQASQVPVFVYNNPQTTGVLLKPADLVLLVKDGVQGIKDGSKDVGWLMACQALLTDEGLEAEIIPGNSTAMLYAHIYELKAVTSGASVTFPKLSADIFNALNDGQLAHAAQLHALLLRTRRTILNYGNAAMATYALLHIMDIPPLGVPRPPWKTLKRGHARELLADLRSIKGLEHYAP